jgi:arabinose-5-phosphate isomerase
MPLGKLGDKISNAVIEMSGKGLGCVGITDGAGKLVGIITDGDLRRHMRDNIFHANVEDVMTKNPKTIRPHQLVSEALELLNTMKITALFVIDDDRPVGVVHLHDLLRTGAA